MQAAFAVLSAVLKAILDAYLFATSLGQYEQGPTVSIIVPVCHCYCVARLGRCGLPVMLLRHVQQMIAWPLNSCTYIIICLSKTRK